MCKGKVLPPRVEAMPGRLLGRVGGMEKGPLSAIHSTSIFMAVMKNNTGAEIIREFRRLEKQREQTLDDLLASEPLLSGSLSVVKRRCGKANCHCAAGEGHPQLQVVFLEDGNRRSRIIRNADADKVDRWATAAQRFRSGTAQLKAIENQQKALLIGLRTARSRIYEPRN